MPDELFEQVRTLLSPDYEIEQELGRGGMAVVYQAVQRSDGSRVAIKVLPPHLTSNEAARERFVREARLAAALRHPGIVPVYAAASRGDIAWYVMQLVEGESLIAKIERESQLSVPDAQQILAQVAEALEYAHDRQVVHRDIKPENILLDAASGRAMLTDFGIARALDDNARLTLDGAPLGTPMYMAPEHLSNPDTDARADIYSLGIVGYEMLTGRPPFTSPNQSVILAMHLSNRAVPLLKLRPDVPLSMAAAIEGALEKKPENRWQTARAFRDALGDLPLPALEPAPVVVPFYRAPEDGGIADSVIARIRRFRLKAVVTGIFTVGILVFDLVMETDFMMSLWLSGPALLDLLRVGSDLYAEDIPFRDLFRGDPRRTLAAPTLPREEVPTYGQPYEVIQQAAKRDYADIHRMLGTFSEIERGLVPDVPADTSALHKQIEGYVTQLRGFGPYVDIRKDVTGRIMAHLEGAAEMMHTIRVQMLRLRHERFEAGLAEFRTTLERARTLSQPGYRL